MSDLYVYTLFEKDRGRPRCTGVKAGNHIQFFDLYRPGARKTIATINKAKHTIRDLITRASNAGHRVVISDFKAHLEAFELPLEVQPYNVYDLHLHDLPPTESLAKDSELIKQILEKMAKSKLKDYQKVFANAAVVYQYLENRGLVCNYVDVHPRWSQKTFSGRSKSLDFNVQGYTDNTSLLPRGAGDHDVNIHFDWISADIRIASLFSRDPNLEESFLQSDPYDYMMEQINVHSTEKIDRSEAKLFLLKSINSMDMSSQALTTTYPLLGEWIGRCRNAIAEVGYLETLLGRRFRIAHAKNELAVLNGAMQGSVAHGMQNVVRRVWEVLGTRLITDIHDSLVVSSPPDPKEIKSTIAIVAPIMLHPFEGLLGENPAFPLKVSIGKRWRKWKLFAVYRASGVEYVASGAKTSAEAVTSEVAETAPSVEAGEGSPIDDDASSCVVPPAV
jgi:hypothetical protein